MIKECSKCNERKPIEYFHKNKRYKDGHYNQCRECHKAQVRKNWLENKDTYRKRMQRHYQENKEAYKAKKIRYYNKQSKATPTWLSEEQINQMKEKYWLAKDLKAVTGEEYHVDHIIPINGENVSGLHVPWNLQVLPSDINLSKSNTF